ncbi:hypothetical protein Tco_1360082 [Tanacetum coccineum]
MIENELHLIPEIVNNNLGGKVEVGLIILEEDEKKLEIVVAMRVEESLGEVRGVENKSSMGSMLMAKGEECLDGWVGAGRGEVKGGGVNFGVTKSLLGEIPMENTGESGGEELGVDGWAV